jgi:N-acetylneuraminate synthase/sialic acid synthase
MHYLHEAIKMRGNGIKRRLDKETYCLRKMEKSLYPAKTLPGGWALREEDVVIKSPGGGIPPYELSRVIGKVIIGQIGVSDLITWDRLEI